MLASHRQLGAHGLVIKHILPVDAGDNGLNLIRRVTHSVKAANDGADAGTRDRTDGNALALHDLQHADVCGAARATTAEDKTNAGLLSHRHCVGL